MDNVEFDPRFDDPEFDRAWVWAVSLFNSEGQDCTLPDPDNIHDLEQFMQGIGFALADYDFPENYDSIESALTRFSVISPELRAKLLDSAENMLKENRDWFRWPDLRLRSS